MIKKVALAVSIIMCFLTISVFGMEAAKPQITVGDEFYIYSEDADSVCEILQSDSKTLDKYLGEKKIIFFALNADNSKQIRISEFEDVFSKTVKNISALKDNDLKELIPDIIGTDKIEGEVVKNGDQKYIKTEYDSQDGEFYLTQYNTVANGKNYVLSFLTRTKPDDEFINTYFNSFADSNMFKSMPKEKTNGTLIVVGIVLISLIAAAITITIIKDTVKAKREQQTNKHIQNKREDS